MHKILILSLALLFTLSGATAQTVKQFPEDRTAFMEALEKFMNATKHKPNKLAFETFEENLTLGRFSDEQLADIQVLANQMLGLKMNASTYFESFLRSLNMMIAGEQSNKFATYINTLQQFGKTIKSNNKTTFKDFTNFAADLFEKNALRYAKSGSVWFASNDNYSIIFKDNKPQITFNQLDMMGLRKSDTIYISETAGTYFPIAQKWLGKKAKVTWEHTKLGKEVYCTFNQYTLETKTAGYKVDTVTLYYPAYFPAPLQGAFEDRLVVRSSRSEKTFPEFSSFNKVMEINNIGEGIKYKGGFRLAGDNMQGYGDGENKATMLFFAESGKLAISSRSNSYLIRRGDRVVSNAATVSIYHGQDSIFHPRIGFKFDVATRYLSLRRGDEGVEKAPFYNSYHKFEINAPGIDWQIDSDSIEIGKTQKVGTKRDVTLESIAYYDANTYRRYQNIANFHPLAKIRSYAGGYDSPYIEGEDLAAYINSNYTLESIMPMITELVKDGFIVYDPATQMVEVKEKVFHWVDAHTKKADYDNIRIYSNNKRNTNGVLDVNTNTIKMRGVKNVILSDSQLVVIKPADAELMIKKNRDMQFNGQVLAGYGIFKGRNFQFSYEDYDIEMDTINSFSIRYAVGRDTDGTPLLKGVTTRIEDMTGHLQIDAPDNKSGRIDDPIYASFVSRSKARAYYDRQTGSYNRDSFYFEIDPFTFDSLNSFDSRSIGFDGTMYTNGIFPDFKERLKIQQDDQSLGFTHKTPPGGMSIYTRDGGNRGTYSNDIRLNSNGLWGSGKISFLNSTFQSDKINFMPDYAKAQANTFRIEGQPSGIQFPAVEANDVFVDWAPYQDSMYIRSDDKPFNFFNNEKQLNGNLVLTPNGLYGSGKLDWADAEMTADKLLFGFNGVKSDTANLNIKTLNEGIAEGKLAFNTENVKADLNFSTQRGTFQSNSEDIDTEMPYNQYRTSMNRFTWNMKNDEIIFSSRDGKKGEFLSINPEQDSLGFKADSATYSFKNNTLDVGGVESINVGDAIIYPHNGFVAIREEAEMQPLEHATIVANTTNLYHEIIDANIKIASRNRYEGSGYYIYDVGGVEQEIFLENIAAKKKKKKEEYVTAGSGPAGMDSEFLIDDKIQFKGGVKLRADAKNLIFKGLAKINAEHVKRSGWFSIHSKVDKEDVAIAYRDPVDEEGAKLHVGLMMNVDSAHVYPAVMTPGKLGRDVKVFSAEGVLKHDKKRQQFMFGDSSQIILNEKRGNKLTIDETDGKVTAVGSFNFDEAFKDNIHIKTAGLCVWEDSLTQFDLIAGLDIPLPKKLLDILAEDLYGYGNDLPDIDVNDAYIEHALTEFVDDDKKLEKVMSKYRSGKGIDLPKDYVYPFFFSKLPLRWNNNTYSFTSKFIGISAINGKPVEKIVKCYFEIKLLNSIPSFTMYIDSPSDDWYYIHYKSGQIFTLSSNEEYSAAVLDTKKKERIKAPTGEYLDILLAKLEDVRYFSGKMRNN